MLSCLSCKKKYTVLAVIIVSILKYSCMKALNIFSDQGPFKGLNPAPYDNKQCLMKALSESYCLRTSLTIV